jgi:subfamily B ATP-binding cassette protein MsbA
MSTLRRLAGYVWPYRLRALATFGCMALLALTTAAYGFLVGPMLAFLVTGDFRTALPANVAHLLPSIGSGGLDRERILFLLPLVLVAISVVKGASYAGQFFLMGTIAQEVVADLRRALFGKLVTLPPAFYAKRHTGDLHSRLAVDVQNVENAIVWALSSYVRDSLQVLVLLTQAFVLDWRLSVIAFGALPATIVPVARFAKRLKRITRQSNEAMGRVSEATHEALGGIRVVQAFSMEAREKERFDGAVRSYLALMRKSLVVRALSTPTMEVIAVAGLGAAIAYAGHAVASGEVDGKLFLSFVATVLLMVQPAKTIGRVGNFMLQGLAGAERVFEVLDAPVEIADVPGARRLAPIERSIAFEKLSFRYGAEDRWILRDVDLTVRRGEVVALVGSSGSGKTTLANLVPRFYDAVEGRVAVDGTDVRDVTLASLRGQLALVTQESLLFNESVAANIAYGRPGASREEVEAAARAANAHAFILALPQGYETVVGERGVLLSGGQKQRLAIARALLKDAPILILDEATSALDAESEAEVQRALETLMAHRTVLVIAHRLSTVRHADRIVVLSEGRIVEQGSHDQLMTSGGDYARMVALQRGAAHVEVGAA